jgi:hypothetical protein
VVVGTPPDGVVDGVPPLEVFFGVLLMASVVVVRPPRGLVVVVDLDAPVGEECDDVVVAVPCGGAYVFDRPRFNSNAVPTIRKRIAVPAMALERDIEAP